jgi:hypothetical protein
VEQLNQIQFETPPMAELDFSYNPAAAQGSWRCSISAAPERAAAACILTSGT